MEGEDASACIRYRERVKGKKAAVVGHFHHLETTLGGVAELSILEKRPVPGDYPDSACEFLLPSQDYVLATGETFINKTFPRLLALSQETAFILVGPSVPLAPFLLDCGVRDLQGFVVTDPERCRKVVNRENQCGLIFDSGKMVSLTPELV
jgi:uncharacterized protein (DUF4213/DUF364 family)